MTTLYRPVGLKEFHLVQETGVFPPRLPQQPIFYPVLNHEYASEIAGQWNTVDPVSDYVGIVLEFEIDSDFVSRYDVHIVGSATHQELWVPAEELEEFNAHIQGDIRPVSIFYGPQYAGEELDV